MNSITQSTMQTMKREEKKKNAQLIVLIVSKRGTIQYGSALVCTVPVPSVSDPDPDWILDPDPDWILDPYSIRPGVRI
jgi:hypothetical protein